jgi:aspartokinase
MRKISDTVREILSEDDLARLTGARGILNFTAYAREIKDEVEQKTMKPVQVGSIATAVSRYLENANPLKLPPEDDIQQISVQTNLKGVTYERTEAISKKIRSIYNKVEITNKTYVTITQGINEITLIGEERLIDEFRKQLKDYDNIYDIDNLVGITVKFGLNYLEIPNLFYLLIRKLALKNINIVEMVSTATEMTFIIDKQDMQGALDQLQKGL